MATIFYKKDGSPIRGTPVSDTDSNWKYGGRQQRRLGIFRMRFNQLTMAQPNWPRKARRALAREKANFDYSSTMARVREENIQLQWEPATAASRFLEAFDRLVAKISPRRVQ